MSFADDINKFAKKAVKNSNSVVRNTLVSVGQKLVARTPVGDANFWQSTPPPGYVGGHARFNWMLSMGARVVQEIDGVDTSPGGASTIQKITDAVPKEPGDNVFFIQNSVPYIERLEDGYSRQAPNGFLALTALEFQNIVNEEVINLK